MRLGVDLGGTKIELIALDDAGQVLCRFREPTPQGDYAGTIRLVVELIRRAESQLGLTGSIGIGIPGCVSSLTGRVKNANSVCLIDQPLAQDLQVLLGDGREVRLANDANCFAVSEANDGAAAGAFSVMGVILGTGVGSGLVLGGQVIAGVNGIAGEWGHNPLPPASQRGQSAQSAGLLAEETPGPACYCGRFGCIEAWLSGPGWAADHQRSLRQQPALGAPALTSRDIVAAMRAGDAAAIASFDRYLDRLARGLASVINVFDPEVIVLGGGLSQIDELYPALPQRLPAYVFSDQVLTRVVRNRHGDSSGVRGAAWLWPIG